MSGKAEDNFQGSTGVGPVSPCGGTGEGRGVRTMEGLPGGIDFPRLAAECVPQFIWTATPDGSPEYCSPFWQRYSGLPMERWSSGGWSEVVHPDDAAATAAAMAASVLEGKPLDVRHRLRSRCGEYRWFQARLNPARDAEGHIVRWVGTSQDIDDLVRLENSLRWSEGLFHDLTRFSPVGLFRTDLVGRCTYVNETWESISGMSREESLGDGWLKAVFPEDRVRLLTAWQAAVDAGTAFHTEYRLQHPVSGIRWGMVQAALERDEAGKPRGYVGTVTDITELKEAEARLQEKEERFRRVFNSAPLAMALVSGKGQFQQVSQRMEALLGYSAAELCEKTLCQVLHPSCTEDCRGLIGGLLHGGDGSRQLEVRLVGNVGQIVWARITATAVVDANGAFLHGVLMMEDINERRMIEAELQKVTQSFRTLAALAPVGIFRLDLGLQCTYVNERWCEMTGLNAEAAVGRGWMGIVPAEQRERVFAAWKSAVDAGVPYQFEGPVQRLGGETMWVICQTMPERGPQGEIVGYIGTLTDITVRKKDEEQQLLLERRLQEAQKLESLAVLAGGVAHDFNNLLTGILGNAALAKEGLSPAEGIHYHLQQIEVASLRAAELCKQMLAYSGKGRFVVESLGLNSVIEDTIQVLKPSISGRVALKLDLTPRLPAVKADASQMRQLVMNLVLNAAEAIGDKSGLISIATGVLYASRSYFQQTAFAPDLPEGEYVFFEVSDTGVGMNRDTQKRIFDPFFSTKFVGRGLGLPAVLGIVRGHKGAIHVYSEEGRGSTFKVLLPCAPRRVEEPVAAPASSAQWRGSGLVLLVDDEQLIRSVTSQMLSAFGFDALTASSGQEGLEIFREKADQIRLVLLDLTMPGMDGVQVFRELRAFRPETRVLLMSGFNEVDAVNRFAGRGLAGFLQKPFKPEALRDKLRAILG